MSWLSKFKWWHTHEWSQWSTPTSGNLKYTVSHNDGPYFPRKVPIYAQVRTCKTCKKAETRVQDYFGNKITSINDIVQRER